MEGIQIRKYRLYIRQGIDFSLVRVEVGWKGLADIKLRFELGYRRF